MTEAVFFAISKKVMWFYCQQRWFTVTYQDQLETNLL